MATRGNGSSRLGRASGTFVLACVALAGGGALSAEGPSTPTIEVDPSPLTPYTSGGCSRPSSSCYQASGTADPGVTVELTVTDSIEPSNAILVTTRANAWDDPGTGAIAGEWSISPNVSDLGEHGTTGSPLTFTAVARSSDGVSPPASVTVTKESATPGDLFPPVLTASPQGRPDRWCHTGLGDCSSGQACLAHTTLVTLGGQLGMNLGGDPRQQCTGEAQISGSIDDYTDQSFGIASEIADVVIAITRQDGTPHMELHPILRVGTRAFYGATLHIEDFPAGTYQVIEYGVDAAGNKSDEHGPWFFRVSQT